MKPFILRLLFVAAVCSSVASCRNPSTNQAATVVFTPWSCDTCPVIEQYVMLDEDADAQRKIEKWRAYTADERNNLQNLNNAHSFYIDKSDITKVLCDACPEAQGIMVTFGYDEGSGGPGTMIDTTTVKPRRLVPFISAAKMNRTMSSYETIGTTNRHARFGCPSYWCNGMLPIASNP